MKRFITSVLLFVVFVTNAQQKHSIEVTINTGMPFYTSLDKMDNLLTKHSYPTLANRLDWGNNLTGGGEFTFRFGRWGLKIGTLDAGLNSKMDANRHYYSGRSESYNLGLSYDWISKDIFIFSPYVVFGSQDSEIYLDYELKEGIVPTSLLIKGKESNVAFGGKLYVRVAHWHDTRLKLFLNIDTSYNASVSNTWRFDNMLVKSDDFNLSTWNILGGISLRFDL